VELPLPDDRGTPSRPHCGGRFDLAILTGTCGKIARDVSLLMQDRLGRAFEPSGEGRGGSSTMRTSGNPVAAATALAAATMARTGATIFAAQVQDHERSAGRGMRNGDLRRCSWSRQARARRIVDIAEGPGSRCGADARQPRRDVAA